MLEVFDIEERLDDDFFEDDVSDEAINELVEDIMLAVTDDIALEDIVMEELVIVLDDTDLDDETTDEAASVLLDEDDEELPPGPPQATKDPEHIRKNIARISISTNTLLQP